MDVQHLFDSRGDWIAFRLGEHVFDPGGDWVGWLPWDDGEIVDAHGEYLGTIVDRDGSRLYRYRDREYRGYPGYRENPGYPGYPGHPDSASRDYPPFGADDVDLLEIPVS